MIEEVEPTEEEKIPFTIAGNGEVEDDIVDDPSKEFFTVKTKGGNTFFLVIDRARNSENVYMLSMIDEYDLQEFLDDNHSQKLLSFRYNIDTNRVEARFTDGSAVANRMPNCLRTSSTRYFTVGLTRRIECHRFFMATAENHCNVFCVTNWSSE